MTVVFSMMKLYEYQRHMVRVIAYISTYELGFVGWRSFGDGF